jgi:hypothetical protein
MNEQNSDAWKGTKIKIKTNMERPRTRWFSHVSTYEDGEKMADI